MGEGTRVWRSDKRQQDHSGVGQGTRKALTYAFSRPWESGPLFLDRDGFWGRGLHYRTGQCEQSVHPSEPDSGVGGGSLLPPGEQEARGACGGLTFPLFLKERVRLRGFKVVLSESPGLRWGRRGCIANWRQEGQSEPQLLDSSCACSPKCVSHAP